MHKSLFRKNFLICAMFLLPTFTRGNAHENIFPIEEESLEEVIQKKLQSIPQETLREKQKEWKETIVSRMKSPKAVQNIGEAFCYRRTFFDPSVIVNQDITDLDGNIIAKQGTTINALEHKSLTSGLLLIDGTKTDHIDWAKSQEGAFKWVLVRGSPIELENQEARPIFFDQGGVICSQFDIENVPCRVTQQGSRLLIEEVPIKRP